MAHVVVGQSIVKEIGSLRMAQGARTTRHVQGSKGTGGQQYLPDVVVKGPKRGWISPEELLG